MKRGAAWRYLERCPLPHYWKYNKAQKQYGASLALGILVLEYGGLCC